QVTFSSSADSLPASIIQSEDPEYFSFVPQEAWVNVLGEYFNEGSEHLTQESGASTTLMFRGDRVALYGTYGQGYTTYGTQLDDGPMLVYNGSRTDMPMDQQLLFKADLLDRGVEHNLTLKSLATSDGAKFTVDYAEVDKASN
ncbi:hypothetical protein HDZ31DRAFT_9158, partial [Schizophyllum fasciatum]